MTAGAKHDSDATAARVVNGKYKLVRKVGAGGMGAVYEAINLNTSGRVALKLLHPHAALTPMDTERFLREARIAASLNHANIVRVADTGRASDGAWFIEQEFLDGEPLSSVVGQGRRLALRDALTLFLPVLDALEYAHSQHVIHRDLKPANIFLARNHRGEVTPKVIDFGIAKFIHDLPDEVRTATGMVLGTPAYMSPEQLDGGGRPIDHRADLWSAAVVLYVMLAGRGPFGVVEVEQLIVKILRGDPDDLRLHARDLPADVAAVLRKALTREREGRYGSAREFAEALQRCAERRGPARLARAGAVLGGVVVLGSLALLGGRAARPVPLPAVAASTPVSAQPQIAALLPAPARRTIHAPDAAAADPVVAPSDPAPSAPRGAARSPSAPARPRHRGVSVDRGTPRAYELTPTAFPAAQPPALPAPQPQVSTGSNGAPITRY